MALCEERADKTICYELDKFFVLRSLAEGGIKPKGEAKLEN